jgi:hypothetical protein
MKFRESFVVALLAFPLTAWCAQADEAPPPNYLLFAIKTDLQRELLFSTRADAYAQFDVAACVGDRKLDLKRFDRVGFQQALAALAHRIGKANPRLDIGFRYADVSLDPDDSRALKTAVKTACRQAGFRDGRVARDATLPGFRSFESS